MQRDPFGDDDKKLEAYEERFVSRMLLKLGHEKDDVKALKNELGPNFGWDWFNGEAFIDNITCGSIGPLRLDLFGLFKVPKKQPLVFAFDRAIDAGIDLAVFHAFDYGEWLAINLRQVQPCELPFDLGASHLVIETDNPFNLYRLTDLK